MSIRRPEINRYPNLKFLKNGIFNTLGIGNGTKKINVAFH
jgi:hypothetical protein